LQKDPPFDVSVIIVNYNTGHMLGPCLNSLRLQRAKEVIIVDNASRDDSLEIIGGHFKDVKLIASPENLGFARANNLAAQSSSGKYLFFLNPDTEVMPGAIRTLITFMEENPKIGLAGATIINPDGTGQSSWETRYPGQRPAGDPYKNLPGKIAWILGAAMITERKVFQDMGGFDSDFFLYGEDLDLCLRYRKAGWEIAIASQATVTHWGAESERTTPGKEVWRKKFAAEILFYKKHYSSSALEAIRRRNLLKALWRMATIGCWLPFFRNKTAANAKFDKYLTMYSSFKGAK